LHVKADGPRKIPGKKKGVAWRPRPNHH